MLQESSDIALSEKSNAELWQIGTSNVDVFWPSFIAGPPAKVDALHIELKPEVNPTRVRLRNYSQEKRQFLHQFFNLLLTADMAYMSPSEAWACAPLLVPKDGPSLFCFNVDPRPVNCFTVKHHFSMQNVKHELRQLSTSRYFAIFYSFYGYWQLPRARGSQECRSFITSDSIHSTSPVLLGTTNAVMHL